MWEIVLLVDGDYLPGSDRTEAENKRTRRLIVDDVVARDRQRDLYVSRQDSREFQDSVLGLSWAGAWRRREPGRGR